MMNGKESVIGKKGNHVLMYIAMYIDLIRKTV